MIPLSQIPQLNEAIRLGHNNAIDEFLHQILKVATDYQENVLEGSKTKPIFRNAKVIHNQDDILFNEYVNTNELEVLVSFEADRATRPEICGRHTSLDYNIYARVAKTGITKDKSRNPVFNAKKRLIDVLDSLEAILTTDSPVSSVINTDVKNTDPLKGHKYKTTLSFNKIQPNSRFELLNEEFNQRNFVVGGFTYNLRVIESDINKWNSQSHQQSLDLW